MKRTNLRIEGICRDSDEGRIKSSLRATNGVENVTVNIQSRTVIVDHDSQSTSDLGIYSLILHQPLLCYLGFHGLHVNNREPFP